MKEMEKPEFPAGLHEKIMRRIYFYRLRNPLLGLFGLLVVDVTISGWHVWTRMIQLNTLSILSSIFDGFEASTDFFINATQNISDIIPITSLSVFAINVILLAYVSFLLMNTKKMSAITSGRLQNSVL